MAVTDKQLDDLNASLTAMKMTVIAAHPDPANRPSPIRAPVESVDVGLVLELVRDEIYRRDPGTPPDVQHFTFPQVSAYARAGQIQHHAREFNEQGFEWIRATMHTDGKLYIDGWRIRPRKEAPFAVLDVKKPAAEPERQTVSFTGTVCAYEDWPADGTATITIAAKTSEAKGVHVHFVGDEVSIVMVGQQLVQEPHTRACVDCSRPFASRGAANVVCGICKEASTAQFDGAK